MLICAVCLVVHYVFFFFILSRLGLVSGRHLLAAIGALVASSAFAVFVLVPEGPVRALDAGRWRAPLLLVGLAGAALTAVAWPGWVLAGHDPIIVPTLADAVIGHATTMDVYRAGDPGFTYPPGYPILFAPLHLLLDPLASLIAFKIWTVCLLALLPVGWAWLAARLFAVPLPFWLLLLLSYLTFFGLERTATYTLEHGKNAQILAGALFPLVAAMLLIASRRNAGVLIAALGFAGAVFVHYSILYLAASFFAAYFLVRFPGKTDEWRQFMRLGLSACLGLGIFLLAMHAALADPRAGSFALPDLKDGLGRMAAVLLGREDEVLFIFNGAPFSNIHSPYRGLWLIGALLAALASAVGRGRRGAADPSGAIARMGAIFAIMLLIGVAFGTGTLSVGITQDFTRWYLFLVEAALMLAGLSALAAFAKVAVRWIAWPAGASLVALLVLAVLLGGSDFARMAQVYKAQRVAPGDLRALRDDLLRLSAGAPCFLVTESFTIAEGLHTVQTYKPLEYAEILTGCRIVNGSFVQRGIDNGRKIDGLPDGEALAALPSNAAIFLVAPETLQRRYAVALPDLGFGLQPGKIGPLSIWRLTPAMPAGTEHEAGTEIR